MFPRYCRLQKSTNNHTTMKQESLVSMIAMTNRMMIMTTMDITIITITMYIMSRLSSRPQLFRAMNPTPTQTNYQALDLVRIMLSCLRLKEILSTLMISTQLKEDTTPIRIMTPTTIIQMIILVKLMLVKDMKTRLTAMTTDQTV